jgi:hypothetical protein
LDSRSGGQITTVARIERRIGRRRAAVEGRVMHIRRFGLASRFAALSMLAASACATGVDGAVADDAGDVTDDRGGGRDGSSLSRDGGSNPYDAWRYDAFGGFPDGSMSSYDSPAGDEGAAEAGGSDVAEAEGGVTPVGLQVLYAVQDSAATSAYMGCELSIVNSGSTPVALSGLEARYYYTDEVHLAPQMTINWSHVSTSGADAPLTVTWTVVPLQPPSTNADTYVAFDFTSSHSMLAPGESAVFSWQLQGPDPSKDVYTQANDYSFNANMTALAPWSHVILAQGGTVVWGSPP